MDAVLESSTEILLEVQGLDDGWANRGNLPPVAPHTKHEKPPDSRGQFQYKEPRFHDGLRQSLKLLKRKKAMTLPIGAGNASVRRTYETMNGPLISVVMVTRNVECFLAEAIESILGQTFRDFEFIIVDFGSIDRSKEIVSGYAARDQRIRMHEIPDCGLAEARNAGCFLARGKYIAIMDADDISLPDRLMWELEFMGKHLEVGVLGGAREWIDAAGKSLFVNGDPTEDREIRSALAFRCAFCQPTVLIRTEAFALVGGYRPVFAPAEDYDLWLRISEHFECANLKQVLLKYRIHPRQVSLRNRKQQTLSILAARASASLRKNGDSDPLNTVGEITPELLVGLGVPEATQQTALASDCRDWVRNMRIAGEYQVALKTVMEILRSSDLEYAEGRSIADLWLSAASLYWRQKEFVSSLRGVAHAVMARPAVIGRPIKQLLELLELA